MTGGWKGSFVKEAFIAGRAVLVRLGSLAQWVVTILAGQRRK
jgi:hypothetical protein